MVSIISENQELGTVTEAIFPRIVIDWNPYTNDGMVTFMVDRMTTQSRVGEPPLILERGHVGTMSDTIGNLLAQDYVVAGQSYPGALLMALIKAASDGVYERRTNPLPSPEPPDTVEPESSGAPANP